MPRSYVMNLEDKRELFPSMIWKDMNLMNLLERHEPDEPTGTDEATDVIAQADGHNNVGNEDCNDVHHENTMADIANANTQEACDNQVTNEGGESPWNQRVNMGHGFQRMNRSRRGKLPIIISKGNIRPLVPIITAKYATKCNISVKNHVLVFKHWKEYKKQPAVIDHFWEDFVQSLTLTQMIL